MEGRRDGKGQGMLLHATKVMAANSDLVRDCATQPVMLTDIRSGKGGNQA